MPEHRPSAVFDACRLRDVPRLGAALIAGVLLQPGQPAPTGTMAQLWALIGEPAEGLSFRAPVRGTGGQRLGDEVLAWTLDVHLPTSLRSAPELRRTAQAAALAARTAAASDCMGTPPPMADLFLVPEDTLPPRMQGLYAVRGGRGVLAVQLEAGQVPPHVVAHEVAHWWAATLCVVDRDADERLALATEARFKEHWPSPEIRPRPALWEQVVRLGFPREAFFQVVP